MPSLSCTCVLECWTQSIITYYMLLNKIHHSGPSPSFWNLILYPTHWSPSLTLAFFFPYSEISTLVYDLLANILKIEVVQFAIFEETLLISLYTFASV